MMVSEHLKLQYRIINRWILETGVPVFLGYLIGLVIFACISAAIFRQFVYPEYFYTLIPLYVLFRISKGERNIFFRSVLNKAAYFRVRLAENGLLILPFTIVLLVFGNWYLPLILIAFSVFTLFIPPHKKARRAMPTPFYKYPFEFIAGFRKVFLLLLVAYALVGLAWYHGNIGAGIASIILIYLVCSSFYSVLEDPAFVWVFWGSPRDFIIAKIKTSILLTSATAAPAMLILFFMFPADIPLLLLIALLGQLYAMAVVLAKYWAFPKEVSLIHAFFIALAVCLPPLYLFILPLLYMWAIRSLSNILK